MGAISSVQKMVDALRKVFDEKPIDYPKAKIPDKRVSRWYDSIGLFTGEVDGIYTEVHLLLAFDKRSYALLVDGDLRSVFHPRDIKKQIKSM